MGTFIPVIWAEALRDGRLARMNAIHHVLQRNDLSDEGRREWRSELAYEHVMLQRLGYRAVLHEGVYQLEE